jgi:isocitrate dehydrogenase (NAD+)
MFFPRQKPLSRTATMTTLIPATLIPGDGIGPEIVDATLAALDALRAPFEWDRQIAGLQGVEQAGDPLPQATLDSIHRTRLALKGPLETPSGGGYRSSNVRLREEFKLPALKLQVQHLLCGEFAACPRRTTT